MEVIAISSLRELEKQQQLELRVVRRRAKNGEGFVLTAAAPAKADPKKKGGKDAAPAAAPKKLSVGEVLSKASGSAFRGGVAGFMAGVVQVGTFMWMRTAMNFQYANGGTMLQAIGTLYKEGGIPRLYKGMAFAIIQNPMSRFGDTFCNTGVLAIMDYYFPGVPIAAKTALASLGGATWRIGLTPIDTFKTTLQVQGTGAFELLKKRVATGGIGQLYSGCVANFTANWVGNYPWFVTFNFLQAKWPKAKEGDTKGKLIRNALIGVASSAVSDTVSNSLRVIKTVKQTNTDGSLSYVDCVKNIIAKDGLKGLFGRGLSTRLLTNMLQSMVFSVGWKAIEEELNKKAAGKKAEAAPAKGGKAAAPAKGKGKTASLSLALPGLGGSGLPSKELVTA